MSHTEEPQPQEAGPVEAWLKEWPCVDEHEIAKARATDAQLAAKDAEIAALQKCPVCDGTGLVVRPPGIAGDQPTWGDSQTGPYQCRRCNGEGIIARTILDSAKE